MKYLSMIKQWVCKTYKSLVKLLYKYSIPVFIILFAIVAYILLLYVNHQQSILLAFILLFSFGVFLVVLSFTIYKSRNKARQLRYYADQIRQVNERLHKEVEKRRFLAKELLKINRKQWEIAFFDKLTGLASRQLFYDRIKKSIAHAEREKEKMAILYLDLDGFKSINDALGHNSGDELLKEIAVRLKKCIRTMDTVARLGGDEFVIIITQLKQIESAVAVANKILEEVAKPVMIKESEVFVTASIGIVVYPDNATDVETLIKKADLAMYKAKEKGRNDYQFYDEKMMVAAKQNLALATEIYSAVNSGDFVAYYQPIMDVKNNFAVGVEALARWQHKTRGIIAPPEFIEAAEKNGLIGKISDVIMKQACNQISQWRQKGVKSLNLAVNFSAWQLLRRGILDNVLSVLAQNNINPKLFAIEITEHSLVKDMDHLQKILCKFRDAGIQIAVDDFGIGYSALTYLHTLPIDIIKLGCSFTKNVISDDGCAIIVTAIINLAKQLNIKVIAEGVETKEQKDKLVQLGCQYMQGFYWSRPKLAQEYDEFLRDSGGVNKSNK